ncbi:MAG: hypothetical protein NC127_05300 [Muribaculum sp.]|nr:hypothetical protein [Muribaculum sp.]
MKKIPFLILSLMVLTIAYSKKSTYNADLIRADELMFVRPDSSLLILSALDTSKGFTEEERAWWGLLLTQARCRNYVPDTDDSLILASAKYYEKCGDAHKQAWCHVYLSNIYKQQNNDSLSLLYLRSADSLAPGNTNIDAENAKNLAELKTRKVKLLFAFVLILLLLAVGALIFLIYRHKHKMELLELAKERMVQEAVNNVQERMSKKIMKEKKFSESLVEYIYKIDTTINKIKSIRNMPDGMRLKNKASLILSKKEQKHLTEVIDVCNRGLLSKLCEEFPDLSETDMAMCAIVKIGMSNNDIMFLFDISSTTLTKRKYRMKTKCLGIDSDASIGQWIWDKVYPEEE